MSRQEVEQWLRSFVPFSLDYFFVLLCNGCGEDYGLLTERPRPSNDPPPASVTGFIWGHVLTDSGVCIPGAVVEIVSGPNRGRKVVQKGPCSAWGYDDGFTFDHLPLGVTIRLRATKEGYQPKEVETMAVTTGRALNIVLRKLR